MKNSLVDPIDEGPLDIVGDIHGEMKALRDLTRVLGYEADGTHRDGRRLVFVGDLIDRGPDSMGVVRWIMDLIDRGRAHAVMGNHDLNAVLGTPKPENTWLLGHGPVPPGERAASDGERDEVRALLATLPLALVRDDLRVVHAAWSDEAVNELTRASNVVDLHDSHAQRIADALELIDDPIERNLVIQNDNPVKRITSGPEHRANERFFAGGRWRDEARTRWWDVYEGPMIVFGHYSRPATASAGSGDGLFDGVAPHASLAGGRAMCVDYGVGSRAAERARGKPNGPFRGRLAAMRWPEAELVFDDGSRHPLEHMELTA